jgi:L-rhamnose-H+ transport protein
MGLAMGVSVLIGVQAVIGSFVPLVANTPELVLQRKGLMVIASVLTLLIGLALVAFAGRERERSQPRAGNHARENAFATGLAICVFSGIFSAMLNLGFAFSAPVVKAAVAVGAKESGALNAVWAIALFGGFIPNAAYTGYLLTRNKTWANYTLPRTSLCWLVGLMMALLWYAGIILYGRGAAGMGQIGAVIGWPLFMALIILTSSIWGFVTGEWKTASVRAKHLMKSGLGVLVVASVLLGIANWS